MATNESVQRRRESRKKGDSHIVRLQFKDCSGNTRLVTADLLDTSESGIGISLLSPLPVGATITVRGNLADNRNNVALPATVKWCPDD